MNDFQNTPESTNKETNNSKTPKISVLMPIYNTNENHLKDAINSILNQTFTDFELLILNDSPENTHLDEIINSYPDNRIKYFKNEKNIGITPSRNKLIQLAQGEYLATMDHDDISLPTRFEKQVAYLEANPNTGVIACKSQTIGSSKTTKYPTDSDDIKIALTHNCCLVHPASMLRKSVLIKHHIRYEEAFTPAEDYALFARLIPHTNFYNTPEILFQYRDHENNTTHHQLKKMELAAANIQAFAQKENPGLTHEFFNRTTYTTRIKLFNLIPILTIIKKKNKTKILLLETIPLLAFKSSCKLKDE